MVGDDAERDRQDGDQQIEEDLRRNRDADVGRRWRGLRRRRLVLQRRILGDILGVLAHALGQRRVTLDVAAVERLLGLVADLLGIGVLRAGLLYDPGPGRAQHRQREQHPKAARLAHHRPYPNSPNHRRLGIQPLICLGQRRRRTQTLACWGNMAKCGRGRLRAPTWLTPRKRYARGRCFGGFCIVKASGRMPRSSSRQLTGATIGKPGSARGE